MKFEDCGSSLEGNLKLLFKSTWRPLEYLELYKCDLDPFDVLFIAAKNGFLPNFTTLRFGFSIRSSEMVNRRTCCRKEHIIDDNVFLTFRQHWPRLTTLSLHDVCKRQYKRIAPNLNAKFLPNLSDLAIYMWQDAPMWRKKQVQTRTCARGQTDQLAFWEQLDMIDKMPEIKHDRLRHLTLQRFVCAATHLHAVAVSALSSRLDKLDISHSSYVTGCLFILVGHSFPCLNTLILSDCQLNERDFRSLATACTKGRLQELTMLDISHNSNLSGCLNLLLGCALQSLKNLILVDCGLQTCDLKHLAMAKSEERLPELRYLDISNNAQISGELEHLFCFGQNWSDLLTLNTEQPHAFGSDFEVLLAKISSGALQSLHELTVSSDNTEFQSRDHNFEKSNLCNLKIVLPSQKYSKDKLFQFFSRIIDKSGFKKLRILSLVHANFGIQDDEDYNPLFARLLELTLCLQPFSFPFVFNNDICSNEQIGERIMDMYGCFSSSFTRIDASGLQSFFQRLAVSSPDERPKLLFDFVNFLLDALVSLCSEDNELKLSVDRLLSIINSNVEWQNMTTILNDIHRSSGSQLDLTGRGVFIYTHWADT